MRKLMFDFSDPRAAQAWHAIDDRVMGGLSRSSLRADAAGHAVFEGEVSLQRNGGFASVRSSPGELGLAGAETCLIEAREVRAPHADGRTFKLRLLMDDGFDGLGYEAGFSPAAAAWQTLVLPLAAFRPTYRGRDVPTAPALDPSRIRQAGLMIAARQAGAFALEVRRIGLASVPAPPASCRRRRQPDAPAGRCHERRDGRGRER